MSQPTGFVPPNWQFAGKLLLIIGNHCSFTDPSWCADAGHMVCIGRQESLAKGETWRVAATGIS
jgi:hypothetical protein